MKNLILIRHAKSSWETVADDFDRILEQRGIEAARLVAAHCRQYLPNTYIVWSSPAKRAAQTARIFALEIPFPPEQINYIEQLYTFDDHILTKIIKTCDNKHDNLILFGHNEAITNFVNKFGDIRIDNVPTAGFVSIQFNTDDWKTIANGRTVKTIFPKDLL